MGSNSTLYQDNPVVAMEVMQSLVRSTADQDAAEKAAYERGWAHCAEAMAKYSADIWEAGYAAAEAAMEEAWKPVARAIRSGSDRAFPTYAQKREMELENCKPRPGDFPGLENDPSCLEQMAVAA